MRKAFSNKIAAIADLYIDGYVPGINDLLYGYVDENGVEHISADAKIIKGKLENMRWLQWVALLSIPLVYLAGQAGLVVAEAGRQPWAIDGLLPVSAAVSSLSAGAVRTTTSHLHGNINTEK